MTRTLLPLVAILLMVTLPSVSRAQKIGVLPFEDAAGVGPEFGEQVGKFIRSEFLKDKKYFPKFIQHRPKDEESPTIDVETAIELGKKHNVDYIVIGTILEAEASSSSSGLGGIRVLGQSVGSSLRTVTATITIQGDLISVKDAQLVDSFRTTGSETDTSVGADVSTEWGSLNADRDGAADTPNAKALREAVEELVEEISARI